MTTPVDPSDVRQVIEHELKTWPVYFDAISFGGKSFEVRRDDRDFQTGDTVRLREWDEQAGYSGRQLKFRIGYVLRGFLPEHVVFALEPLTSPSAPSGWQPIASAPSDGTIFDVWLGNADEEDAEFYCMPGTRRSCNWTWMNGKFRPYARAHTLTVTVTPTHWMPIPSAPGKDAPPCQ